MLFGGEMKQTKLKSLNLQSLNSMDHAKFALEMEPSRYQGIITIQDHT